MSDKRYFGEWIQKQDNWGFEDVWMCSFCSEELVFEEESPKESGFNYCPFCGSDMRRLADGNL